MPIPDFQSFFRPLLEFASDNNEHSVKDARKVLSKVFELTEEELNQKLPSGTQKTFDNRVAWAKSYLIQANALVSTKRAHFKITDRGHLLLSKNADRIDVRVLNQFEEFKEFHTSKKSEEIVTSTSSSKEIREETPEELLEEAYRDIRNDLASELLSTIKSNSPDFFEQIVVDLMIALGYGGSKEDAGKTIGKSGDEGIDGIIKEDRLGLDIIYLQAKRWKGSVGRPEIQKFVGALHGQRAKKGVFITTGKFSKGALEYVDKIDPKVILIDGPRLANFMIDLNLGVYTKSTFEIKKIDTDYFIEE